MPNPPPINAVRHILVNTELAGQRLDNFLFRELKGVPKTHVYQIIRSGQVRRNKGRIGANDRLNAGDMLRIPPIRLSARIEEKIVNQAPAHKHAVIFEDDAFLVIDKPAGTAVHGGSGVSFGVIEQMRRARPLASFLELVHRLDRQTSGLLLIAKKKSALKALQDQFRNREIGKTYLALVKGAWPANLKVIDQPLHKYVLPNGERRVRTTRADDPNAMRAVSLVRLLGSGTLALNSPGNCALTQAVSLLEVTIKTGRTHQIRVHLCGAGHPIVGDDKYGDFGLNHQLNSTGFKRMFLHAWRLRLTHPITGQLMELHAQLSEELLSWSDINLIGITMRTASVLRCV